MMASLFTFENLYRAYLDCRRKKRSKTAALMFEQNAEEELLDLSRELKERTYRPRPSFCFIARNDKHREVFAADFRDRVVHHLVVRYLEPIWEPLFIYDSYACRKGKGSHAGVNRLQCFTRKVTSNQTRRAWFLQMDISAFFPSVDRKLLLEMVLRRLNNQEMSWLLKIILLHDPTEYPIITCDSRKWHNVPRQKSLFSVPAGKGLPIGNLTSQFFANVYLNQLDQFAKHTLHARYYIRYVDDFILLHHERTQLEAWRDRITEFLQQKLLLRLHPRRRFIRPVSNGINFLGYIVRPSHLLVRRRVVANCKKAVQQQLTDFKVIEGEGIYLRFQPEKYERLNATLNSYLGVFRYSRSAKLAQTVMAIFPEVSVLFVLVGFKVLKKWVLPFKPANLYTQYRFFRKRFSGLIFMQVGCFWELFDRDASYVHKKYGLKMIAPRKGFSARCGVAERCLKRFTRRLAGEAVLFVGQKGQCGPCIQNRIACGLRIVK